MAKNYLLKIHDENLWMRFKSACVLLNKDMKDVIIEFIEDFVKKAEEKN